MTGKPKKVRTVHGHDRWKVEYKTAHGRRRQEFFATKAEADARQTSINRAPPVPLHPVVLDGRATLRAYGAEWLAANAPVWQPRTLRSNTDLLTRHVYRFTVGGKALGDFRLMDIQRPHVKALAVARRRERYAPDTVRLMVAALRALLNEAVEDELIPFNPVAALGRGLRRQLARRPEQNHVKAMTTDQLMRFLDTAKRTSKLYVMYLAGARAGLRLGELCGWQLGDLRLDGQVLEADVVRSLGQESSPRAPVAGPTKTGQARTVDISPQLAAELAAIVKRRPHDAMAHGWRPVPPWVFVTKNGTPYGQRNVERDFARVLVGAGFMQPGEPAPFSPHALRHTFACLHLTTATDRNVIQYVQQQLGHSSIKVTVDTYGGWIRLRDPVAADRLDALLANGPANGRP
jgi:integrase